ncbi:MAG: DUF922 domain-containing protein [Pseudomonadota bacterium]
MHQKPFKPVKLSLFGGLMLLVGCTQTVQGVPENTKVTVDYYTVNGKTSKQLDRQIRAKGPRSAGNDHALAVARIKMQPTVRFRTLPGGCQISHAKVTVSAKVTLPRWAQRNKADKRLGRAWDNLDKYARWHEAIHVAIASRFASQMEADLKALPIARNCETAREDASALIDLRLDEHDKAQLKFDADEQKRIALLNR